MSDEAGGPDSIDADASATESTGDDTAGAASTTATTPPPPTGERHDGPRPEMELGPRPPRVPRAPAAFRPSWIIATIAAAVLADLALRRVPWDQAGTTLLITTVAVGLASSGFVRTRSARVMLGLTVIFALFLTWRAGFLLSSANLLTAVGLVTAAAVFGRRGDIWNVGPGRLTAGVVAVLEGVLFVPVSGFEEAEARYHAWNNDGNATARSVIRGVMIAGPVVLLLGALLASADVVFQSFFTGFDLRIDSLIGHLILLVIGAAMMVTLLRVASRPQGSIPTPPGWRLGPVEASILLGAITILFAVFAYAQLVTVMGGADEALGRAGLEPKQFARQGFFQLLWVAGITLAVIMTVRMLTERSDGGRTPVKVLGLAAVALTFVIVAVALARISFYVGDSGLTARRLYAAVITVWIAIGFVFVAARLLGFKRDRAWLTPAVVLSGVVLLLGLNLANPQRRIAENNLDRNESVLVWHVRHGQFVGDGRATLADNLDRLSPDLADEVSEELCLRYGSDRSDVDEPGLFGFNVGRARATESIDRLCN